MKLNDDDLLHFRALYRSMKTGPLMDLKREVRKQYGRHRVRSWFRRTQTWKAFNWFKGTWTWRFLLTLRWKIGSFINRSALT